jgi:hypothetical protein
MRITQTLIAVAAAALLAACSQQPAQSPTAAAGQPAATTAAGEATAVTGSGYPGPAASGAYPAPGGAAAPTPEFNTTPVTVPQPASADVGVAAGTLLRVDPQGNRAPYQGGVVYLGLVQKDSSGKEVMVQLDRAVAPKTVTNGLGQFVFTDVPPGRYALMLDSTQGALLLNDPASGGDFIIEVAGGQVKELGELAYPLADPNS